MRDKRLIEPFDSYRKLGWRVPLLRALKNPKTMTVDWYADIYSFRYLIDSEALHAELQDIWERYKPQCGRRASLSYGDFGGHMGYVPHDAGKEAWAVVRRHFTQGLERLAQEE